METHYGGNKTLQGIPFKVAYFSWLLAKKAVMKDNLSRREIYPKKLRQSASIPKMQDGRHAMEDLHQSQSIARTMPRKIIEVLFGWEEAKAGTSERERERDGGLSQLVYDGQFGKKNSRCFEDSCNSVQTTEDQVELQ